MTIGEFVEKIQDAFPNREVSYLKSDRSDGWLVQVHYPEGDDTHMYLQREVCPPLEDALVGTAVYAFKMEASRYFGYHMTDLYPQWMLERHHSFDLSPAQRAAVKAGDFNKIE